MADARLACFLFVFPLIAFCFPKSNILERRTESCSNQPTRGNDNCGFELVFTWRRIIWQQLFFFLFFFFPAPSHSGFPTFGYIMTICNLTNSYCVVAQQGSTVARINATACMDASVHAGAGDMEVTWRCQTLPETDGGHRGRRACLISPVGVRLTHVEKRRGLSLVT